MDSQRFDNFTRAFADRSTRRTVLGGLGASVAALVLGRKHGPTDPALAATSPCINHIFGSGSATGGLTVSFRVRLSAPAPSGGVTVNLTSSNAAIPIPATVKVPSGATEKSFTVSTLGVSSNVNVTVGASTGTCAVSRSVLIKSPKLQALHLQTVIRGGGNGRATVCILGEAPTGGTRIKLTSSNTAVIANPGTVTIPVTKGCLSVVLPAAVVATDTPVQITASFAGISMAGNTIVRKLATDPNPTQTATTEATNTPTETATNTPTSTATETATNTPTSTATETATNTPTATAIVCVPDLGPCVLNDPGACCSQICYANIGIGSPTCGQPLPVPTNTVPVCTPVGGPCNLNDPGACCSQACFANNADPICFDFG